MSAVEYSTTQEFKSGRYERAIGITTNGGAVEVQTFVGGQWVTADTYDTDGGYFFEQRSLDIRIVPSGGAVYTFG